VTLLPPAHCPPSSSPSHSVHLPFPSHTALHHTHTPHTLSLMPGSPCPWEAHSCHPSSQKRIRKSSRCSSPTTPTQAQTHAHTHGAPPAHRDWTTRLPCLPAGAPPQLYSRCPPAFPTAAFPPAAHLLTAIHLPTHHTPAHPSCQKLLRSATLDMTLLAPPEPTRTRCPPCLPHTGIYTLGSYPTCHHLPFTLPLPPRAHPTHTRCLQHLPQPLCPAGSWTHPVPHPHTPPTPHACHTLYPSFGHSTHLGLPAILPISILVPQ